MNKKIGIFGGGVGKICYDPLVLEAMVSGKPVPEYSPRSKVSREIEMVWRKVAKGIEN